MKAPAVILTRNLDETWPQFLERRLAQGPIRHGAYPATGARLNTLRRWMRGGAVELEYDDNGTLVWRLTPPLDHKETR